MGNMLALESLDLSLNRLSSEIPQSMASVTFLGFLNPSFNNLTGIIPASTQLQGFDASSYVCLRCGQIAVLTGHHRGSNKETISTLMALNMIYVSMSVGFVVGLGAVVLYSTWWSSNISSGYRACEIDCGRELSFCSVLDLHKYHGALTGCNLDAATSLCWYAHRDLGCCNFDFSMLVCSSQSGVLQFRAQQFLAGSVHKVNSSGC